MHVFPRKKLLNIQVLPKRKLSNPFPAQIPIYHFTGVELKKSMVNLLTVNGIKR